MRVVTLFSVPTQALPISDVNINKYFNIFLEVQISNQYILAILAENDCYQNVINQFCVQI